MAVKTNQNWFLTILNNRVIISIDKLTLNFHIVELFSYNAFKIIQIKIVEKFFKSFRKCLEIHFGNELLKNVRN